MEHGHFLNGSSLLHEPFYHGIGIRNYAAFWKRQKDNLTNVQRLGLWRKIQPHDGCVNSIVWNETGERILSGSDDHRLSITNPFTSRVEATIASGHRANIFSACFFPSSDDKQIVSCCGAGEIRYTIVDRADQYGKNLFDCHFGTTYDVVTIPSEPHIFLSCGEDNTVRVYDLRIKTSCTKRNCQEDVLIRFRRGVTALSINPRQSYYLATGSSDSIVRIFDRRMLSSPRSHGDFSTLGVVSQFRPLALSSANNMCPITCVKFADDGEECLVSYSGEQLYLFSTKETMALDEVARSQNDSMGNGGQNQGQNQQTSVKRLRLRGDWSDTGPLARPEAERANRAPSNEAEEREQRFYTTMQRVSDMLTTWLVNYMNRQPSPPHSAQNEQGSDQQGPSAAPNRVAVLSEVMASLPPSLASVASLAVASRSEVIEASQSQSRAQAQAQPESQREREEEENDTSSQQRRERREDEGRRRPSRTSSEETATSPDDEADEEEGAASAGDENVLLQRNEAARRVQRYFRRRAKEKKRQAREWSEVPHCRQMQRYGGHRSVRTMIKEANFWGDKYVISGSDCDRHVVNCVQPHQHLPLLAASGIDYDIKLFVPVLGETDLDAIEARAAEFAQRNAVMLEESKDTLTVPSSFLLRLLAAFNHVSAGRAAEQAGAGAGGAGSGGGADNNNNNNNGRGEEAGSG